MGKSKMIKMLFLIMLLSSLTYAADDEDRKMTPEESREYAARISLSRTQYPDEYPLGSIGMGNIVVRRADGECYSDYASMLSAVFNACLNLSRLTAHTSAHAINIINLGFNQFGSDVRLIIQNNHRLGGVGTASLRPYDSVAARRRPDGSANIGSASLISIGPDFLGRPADRQAVVIAHEMGHACRAQLGVMSRVDGPLVSIDDIFFRKLGWWREEMENVGLIPSSYPFSTENAARAEMGMEFVHSYSGMTADIFLQAANYIDNCPPGITGWFNLTTFYVDFDI